MILYLLYNSQSQLKYNSAPLQTLIDVMITEIMQQQKMCQSSYHFQINTVKNDEYTQPYYWLKTVLYH